mgnify:CR=1 FL=1|tara:strand:- start:5514 stop:6068 length:555 start_codon:yes stop_codon:yes gene_type:complete
MPQTNFKKAYLTKIKRHLDKLNIKNIDKLQKLIIETSVKGKKVIICGNGGSAATASHVSVDLTKNANIRSINFNEYDLITCFSNDFGYQNWVKKSLEYFADPEDLLILISCSGNSKNLVNARKKAVSMKLKTAVITGCKKFNKLNKEKNDVNIWINSNSYNQIEIIHHIILLLIVDDIINLKKN